MIGRYALSLVLFAGNYLDGCPTCIGAVGPKSPPFFKKNRPVQVNKATSDDKKPVAPKQDTHTKDSSRNTESSEQEKR